MRNYKKLIDTLRFCSEPHTDPHECPDFQYGCGGACLDRHLKEAVDVIEQLSMKLHGDEAAIAGMKREIERMVVAGASRWIPVTERSPEDFQKVLVFWWEHFEPMIDTAFWQKDAKRFDGEHWVRMEDKVTHWMPLPEPPCADEKKEKE